MNKPQIDISKINDYGKYFDPETMEMYPLTDEDILALRKYYQNDTIASKRIINKSSTTKELELPKTRNQSANLSPSTRPTYKLTRDQTYNRGHHHTKKNPHKLLGKSFIIGGVVVSLIAGTIIYQITNRNDYQTDISSIEQSYDLEDYTKQISDNTNLPQSNINLDVLNREDNVQSENKTSNENVSFKQNSPENQESYPNQNPYFDQDSSFTQTLSTQEGSEQPTYEQERKMLIKNLCDIYQVDFNIIYSQIAKLSDNFTSSDYLNGTLEGVTCKGEPVQANSEEELLLYTVRCMKQLPEKLGLSNNIYIHNNYVSSTDYCAIINQVANTLGLNRCLLYAIVQSECGFDSPMFNEINNPAGLRNNGEWWSFDTKEEGFIELGMEVIKYYRMIGETPDKIDYETISKIGDIHAPVSDGNELWLPNVLSNLEYAQLHEAEIFPTNEQTNGLSK